MYLFDALRYPLVLCITVGFAGIFYTGGFSGIGNMLGLIASGIVMNGAAALVLWLGYRFVRHRWFDADPSKPEKDNE